MSVAKAASRLKQRWPTGSQPVPEPPKAKEKEEEDGLAFGRANALAAVFLAGFVRPPARRPHPVTSRWMIGAVAGSRIRLVSCYVGTGHGGRGGAAHA